MIEIKGFYKYIEAFSVKDNELKILRKDEKYNRNNFVRIDMKIKR